MIMMAATTNGSAARTCFLLVSFLWIVTFLEVAPFFVSSAATEPSRRGGRGRQLLPSPHTSCKAAASAFVPSWKELEDKLRPTLDNYEDLQPISIDSALDTTTEPNDASDRPTLFRERHGWCPYSERVWLTMELGNVAYDTVRIDNTGGPRPSYFAGQTPQMRWPETNRLQGESMDLVSKLDTTYDLGLASNDAAVQHVISRFRDIFPRARPSSRAAYLFQYNGEPLWKSTFETTLTDTNDLLKATATDEGPFFCGSKLSAADVAWAPFLERYRYQLPCLHQGLEPDDAALYPNLAAWYQAMDQIPAYACRIRGDSSSWRKVLTMAGFGNAGAPPAVDDLMRGRENVEKEAALAGGQSLDNAEDLALWNAYASMRPYVAATPRAEAAMTMVRNRQAILKDTLKHAGMRTWKESSLPETEEEIDETLRELVDVLLEDDADLLTNHSRLAVSNLAVFLDRRMCVPRDMGSMSAACIKKLAFSLQTYN